MSIFPKTASSYSVDYMFQLIQDLSDMPRSSPVAKVVLCKGHTKIQVQGGIGKANGEHESSVVTGQKK
ncbi:hypothetical protein Leryth_021629 [Lithospermum erythrorhizon]|nr:hypothetical protein Leryth_021629 [Lithospermum erythrorhizon]